MNYTRISVDMALERITRGDLCYIMREVDSNTSLGDILDSAGIFIEAKDRMDLARDPITAAQPLTKQDLPEPKQELATEPQESVTGGRDNPPEQFPEENRQAVQSPKQAQKKSQKRERIINLFTAGKTMTEIAEELGLTEAGVYYHLRRAQEENQL